MELQEVYPIGPQPDEAPVHAVANGLRRPRLALVAAGDVAALRGQSVLPPPVGDGAADELFAEPIAGSGVDVVDTGVERGVQHLGRLCGVGQRQPQPDLRRAQPTGD